ncbi:conserved Plasmodium protein, unknown function [Plasmodium vivax]|uniref:(malaria parasite P. vivax) hypothetical protein n=1 Tax=Plasmodium vivax TaxID=5855 RepID=A0A1G4H2X1_PLAVI|nr:unnamed protein product [Plasmodium vivax]CAI7722741.1 conserved protein, unknown function [Plasmodium vivax]SCO69198.1 conserved Plasmodium protein, unknown function [Plasmodium vivax]SCO74674.1 conserved Plasmodium protein, unknown function [Plasmodium vivax]VUZ98149.1 conserved protein, unknown function [Plasmodium vivax]
MSTMENDKGGGPVKIDMKEQQWRIFEYNMSKWMIENKYILDKEEKKKFYKCANYSIGTGVINASLVYFFCKRNQKFFTPMSRFFLTFSLGLYTSMVVNKIFRRKAYMEILTEKTTMTDKAREVMNDILNVKDDVGKSPSTGSANKLGSTSTSNVYSKGLYDHGQAQLQGDPPSKGNVNVPFVQDLNETILNEQMSDDFERQNSYILKEPSEGKYVTWDDIRRMNK